MRRTKFLILFLAACQSSPEAAPAPKKPLRDFRGIIHCHSLFSHDSKGTYEEILAAARAAKIDFICMTDHPPKDDKGRPLREGWTGIHDGVLFIQGAEYSDQILGLGIKDPITGKDRRETIKAIHDQGGVAIACHPELIEDWDAYDEADGMEIYNVHATLQRKAKDKLWMLRIPKVMKENPEGSFQELQELDPAILKKWDEINAKRRFVGIAGNDAHQNVSFFGYQLDPYPRAFRFVTTHVLAEELTQEAVLAALKAARVYVQFELGSTPMAESQLLEWMGQVVPQGSGMQNSDVFVNRAPAYGTWVRDGAEAGVQRRFVMRPIGNSTVCVSEWTLSNAGSYRMTLWQRDSHLPVLLTNHVQVRSGRP